MLLKSLKNNQSNLFHSPLNQMLDMNDSLIALLDAIDWRIFDDAFAKYYSKEGRPAKPIHLMVGLLLLKQIENLSDDNVVLQWKRNPYYQYFCGYNEFQIIEPCHPTDLTYFRNCIGVEGMKIIFGMSVLDKYIWYKSLQWVKRVHHRRQTIKYYHKYFKQLF